jgi:4-hydroxy-tetrahydrodipicolinate synthase
MVAAAIEDDFTTARGLNHKLLEGYELLFAENNPAGVKAFLAEMGVIQNHLRLPLVPLSEGVMKGVRSYLKGFK